MARRVSNEGSIGDVLKEFIEKNKLQAGMDKIDVEEAWKSLMGNGVNSYTKEVVLKTQFSRCLGSKCYLLK